ncbi:MAG: hypothetical protein M3O70_21320 [Actinomycetota bacterium]|nr:hypothetical protein [Actinomycetota bacterium]
MLSRATWSPPELANELVHPGVPETAVPFVHDAPDDKAKAELERNDTVPASADFRYASLREVAVIRRP